MSKLTQQNIDNGFKHATYLPITESEKVIFGLSFKLTDFPDINELSLPFFKINDYKVHDGLWAFFFSFDLGDFMFKECIVQALSKSFTSRSSGYDQLHIHLPYNVFTPEIYVLDEKNEKLIKIPNENYSEYRKKLDEFVDFVLGKFTEQGITYEIIGDSAELYKPMNLSSEEYQMVLNARLNDNSISRSR